MSLTVFNTVFDVVQSFTGTEQKLSNTGPDTALELL